MADEYSNGIGLVPVTAAAEVLYWKPLQTIVDPPFAVTLAVKVTVIPFTEDVTLETVGVPTVAVGVGETVAVTVGVGDAETVGVGDAEQASVANE